MVRIPGALWNNKHERVHQDAKEPELARWFLEQSFCKAAGKQVFEPPHRSPDRDEREDFGGRPLALHHPMVRGIDHLADSLSQPAQTPARQFDRGVGQQFGVNGPLDENHAVFYVASVRSTLVVGVRPMEISWQAGPDRLMCRWTEADERVRYSPPWMRDASRFLDQKHGCAPEMALSKVSPFGGGEWYAPHPPRAK